MRSLTIIFAMRRSIQSEHWWIWSPWHSRIIHVCLNVLLYIPVVPHKAVAEVSKIKNRKPVGEVGCCESGMAERSHWWSERWLISLTISLSLSLTIRLSTYLPTYLSIDLSIYLSLFHLITYLSLSLSLPLLHLSSCLPVYLSIYLSTCLSVYLSVYLSICGAVSFSVM